jgi:ribonuclease HI
MAYQYLTDRPEIKKAVLYTDSLTALDLLNSSEQHDYRTYTDLILQSNEHLQSSGTEIVLAWIPSHVGIPGNETADLHAKLGRSIPIKDTNK